MIFIAAVNIVHIDGESRSLQLVERHRKFEGNRRIAVGIHAEVGAVRSRHFYGRTVFTLFHFEAVRIFFGGKRSARRNGARTGIGSRLRYRHVEISQIGIEVIGVHVVLGYVFRNRGFLSFGRGLVFDDRFVRVVKRDAGGQGFDFFINHVVEINRAFHVVVGVRALAAAVAEAEHHFDRAVEEVVRFHIESVLRPDAVGNDVGNAVFILRDGGDGVGKADIRAVIAVAYVVRGFQTARIDPYGNFTVSIGRKGDRRRGSDFLRRALAQGCNVVVQHHHVGAFRAFVRAGVFKFRLHDFRGFRFDPFVHRLAVGVRSEFFFGFFFGSFGFDAGLIFVFRPVEERGIGDQLVHHGVESFALGIHDARIHFGRGRGIIHGSRPAGSGSIGVIFRICGR